ncbi:MAG TPA: transposase [Anaerolineae bacterium]|nr:transposase [Anaerolineae bacterium]
MSIEDKMTIDERRKYLRVMQERYYPASRQERGRLLDEMEAVTKLHRKSLIRLMHSDLERRPRRKQRGRTYGPEVDDALRVITESLDYICPERLTPNLVWLAEHLAAHGELAITPRLLEQLGQISVSTVGRIVARLRQDEPRLRRRPRRTNHLLDDVPMKRIPWQEQEPGHFEVDLVHHCGPTASGEFVHTLQMIDVATGWSERVAVLGRSYLVMEDGFKRILARLPFPVRELHPDNGSEFFNQHMLRFWQEWDPPPQISRSRPYQKNDNRFVEQKNSTLVRAYLGYDRLDTVAQTLALNKFYDAMWLYYNFFQPVMRLREKVWAGEKGQVARTKRRYDTARTPFDRLCQTTVLSPEVQERLTELRKQTNPRQLRRHIYDLIDDIAALPGATPGVTEDVYLTLDSGSA